MNENVHEHQHIMALNAGRHQLERCLYEQDIGFKKVAFNNFYCEYSIFELNYRLGYFPNTLGISEYEFACQEKPFLFTWDKNGSPDGFDLRLRLIENSTPEELVRCQNTR